MKLIAKSLCMILLIHSEQNEILGITNKGHIATTPPPFTPNQSISMFLVLSTSIVVSLFLLSTPKAF